MAFATPEISALPASPQEQSAAMAALGSNFTDIFIFDLSTMDVKNVRCSPDALPPLDVDPSALGFDQLASLYVSHNVAQDDQERVLNVLRPEGIRNHLGDKQSFIERFRVVRDNGEFVAFYLKCARFAGEDGQECVVIAFSPENTYSYAHGYSAQRKNARNSSKRRVLVVEDSELNRMMLTSILEDHYEVLEAENGKVGLELLAQYHETLSAVLLDVYMPICTGFEFLKISQADDALACVPVIVTTGSSSAEEEVRCLSLGASDFIPKPYNPQVVLGRLRSIIRLRESATALEMVEHDSLTGTFTRQAFLMRAAEWMAGKPEGPFHVLAARVDKFNTLCAVVGHQEANAVVRALGESFLEQFPSAMTGRVEADTLVMLTQMKKVPTESLTQKLRAIVKSLPHDGALINFGAYEYVDTSLSAEAIVDRALLATEVAQYNGYINLAYFDGEVSRKLAEEQVLEAAFPQALSAGEFVPWFQPKYGVQDGKIHGAEALVRWVKPDGSMVSPGAFVPLFERTGVVVQLDAYMFKAVCSFQKQRLDQGLPVVPISVNLSRTSLLRSGVVASYVAAAAQSGVPLELVPIELTESMAVEDSQISSVLEELAQAGFALHLDDFGSGYSSLASLCELPLKVLKIDKSLVDRIGDTQGNMLVKTAVVLAQDFGLEVVAEGVETQDQVDFLRNTKCHLIQGYFYSAPKSQAAFEDLLAQ